MNIGKVCPCGSRMIVKFADEKDYICIKCGKKYKLKYNKADKAYFYSIEDKNVR